MGCHLPGRILNDLNRFGTTEPRAGPAPDEPGITTFELTRETEFNMDMGGLVDVRDGGKEFGRR